jgi:hypothetical protein
MKTNHQNNLLTLSVIFTFVLSVLTVLTVPVNAEVPVFDPDNFDEPMENPLHPMEPGTTWVYTMETDEGTEMAIHTVTHETEEILDIECVVFTESVLLDGILEEHSVNWFAVDNEMNVWYFGEDSKDYEDGEVASTEGSWIAGEEGAMPGIIMLGNPEVGDEYAQENAPGTAEDRGAVDAVDEIVSVPYGTFNHCLRTRDWNPLEPGAVEYKYFAPGLGLLAEEEDEDLELVSFIPPKLSGAKIETSQAIYEGGDEFELTAELVNGTDEAVTLHEYIIMDFAGLYFHYPNWSMRSNHATVTIPAEEEVEQEILSFRWPRFIGSIDRITFWIKLVDPDTNMQFGFDGRCECSVE